MALSQAGMVQPISPQSSELANFYKTRVGAYIEAVDGTDTKAIAAFYDPNATFVHRNTKGDYSRAGESRAQRIFQESKRPSTEF